MRKEVKMIAINPLVLDKLRKEVERRQQEGTDATLKSVASEAIKAQLEYWERRRFARIKDKDMTGDKSSGMDRFLDPEDQHAAKMERWNERRRALGLPEVK